MQIQVETDNHIQNREELSSYVASVVDEKVHRFGEQITSVQVHLHDDTSPDKKADDDFRCLMEARVAGIKPVAVNQHAGNLHQAINGAADKLARSLESLLGKFEEQRRRAVGTGRITDPGSSSGPPLVG